MAKKDKNKEQAVQVNAIPAQGQPQQGLPRPARRPSKPLQLNPIVQPIAFVPYSTQQQELYMWEDEQQYAGGPYYDAQAQAAYDVAAPAYGDASYQASAGGYDQGYYGGYDYQGYQDYGYAPAPVLEAPVADVKKKKKVSAAAIILIVLSLLSIALIVVGKFVNQSFLLMSGETSGLDMIINFFKDITAEGAAFGEAIIMPIAVLVVAVGIVIVLIGSLFGLFTKGATVFAKIGACIAFIGALVGLVVGLIKADTVQIQIGFYILVGLAALTLIIAFAAKNAPKAKKVK